MANHNLDRELIERTLAGLDDVNLPLVDFDQLRNQLKQAAVLAEQLPRLEDELKTLRQDYIGRIVGMLKAVAVVERSQLRALAVSEQIDALDNCPASELVKQYRLAAARFRDAFPATYALRASSRSGARAASAVENYH